MSVHGFRRPVPVIEPHKARYRTAPFPMCFTPASMQEIIRTIGARAPETGGKLFGPTDRMGIDCFELDIQGSETASHAIYAPDATWGLERVEHHLAAKPQRWWWGDIHSHPGRSRSPSHKSGPALGDLGYVEAVFAANEAMQWYFLPIVTLEDDKVCVSPFVISRDDPSEPLIALELRICDAENFPTAQYNPEWESRIEGSIPAALRRLLAQHHHDICQRHRAIEQRLGDLEGATIHQIDSDAPQNRAQPLSQAIKMAGQLGALADHICERNRAFESALASQGKVLVDQTNETVALREQIAQRVSASVFQTQMRHYRRRTTAAMIALATALVALVTGVAAFAYREDQVRQEQVALLLKENAALSLRLNVLEAMAHHQKSSLTQAP